MIYKMHLLKYKRRWQHQTIFATLILLKGGKTIENGIFESLLQLHGRVMYVICKNFALTQNYILYLYTTLSD